MTTDAILAIIGGVVALLGIVLLLGRRPKRLSADPPPASVELAAMADERERQIDRREAEATAEWEEERRVADALRAEADVAGDDAEEVAELMNGGRS